MSFASSKHVLDAGCGTGYGSSYLCEHGAVCVEGIDLSPKAIGFSRKRYIADKLHFELHIVT